MENQSPPLPTQPNPFIPQPAQTPAPIEQPMSTLPPTPNRSPWMKILTIGIIAFLLLSILGLSAYLLNRNTNQSAQISETPTSTPTPTVDPKANWKTYINTDSSYSFKYPQNWYDSFHIDPPPCKTCGGIARGFGIVIEDNKTASTAAQIAQANVDSNNHYLPSDFPRAEVLPRPSYLSQVDISLAKGFPGAGSPGIYAYIVVGKKDYRISFDGVDDDIANEILSTFKFTN